jgi:hypothetical protein
MHSAEILQRHYGWWKLSIRDGIQKECIMVFFPSHSERIRSGYWFRNNHNRQGYNWAE